jgi:hypothetical protein
MAIPFPRASRALNADRFRYTLISLSITGILLACWCVWFFGATIKFTEASEDVWLGEGEVLVAAFPNEKLTHIYRGQSARFYPKDSVISQRGGLPAVVAEVGPSEQTGKGKVSFIVTADRETTALLPDDLNGRVEVDIEQLSPAQLVMRSSGLATDAATPKMSQ